MDAPRIADLVRRGTGAAARIVGYPYDLHRPRGAGSPVRPATLRMRLPAAFVPQGAPMPTRGHPLYEGVFDSGYTLPGDYLVGPSLSYFVASQLALQAVLCVRTTRRLSFARPAAQAGGGLGTYGGMVRAATQPVLTDWPASVVAGGSGLDRAGLPQDVAVGGLSVLLPITLGIVLQIGDLMTDDLGRAGVVAEAELSEHGWRLLVRQAAT
jgi:hypothetical protein